MAGRLFNIVGKQSFVMNFGTTNSSIVLGNRFYDVRDAVTGMILVRLFSMSGLPGSANLAVTMTNILQMPDDPGTLYVAGTGVTGVSLGTNTTTPILNSIGFTATSCGPMVYFTLSTNNATSGTATAVLAVDLLIRDT